MHILHMTHQTHVVIHQTDSFKWIETREPTKSKIKIVHLVNKWINWNIGKMVKWKKPISHTVDTLRNWCAQQTHGRECKRDRKYFTEQKKKKIDNSNTRDTLLGLLVCVCLLCKKWREGSLLACYKMSLYHSQSLSLSHSLSRCVCSAIICTVSHFQLICLISNVRINTIRQLCYWKKATTTTFEHDFCLCKLSIWCECAQKTKNECLATKIVCIYSTAAQNTTHSIRIEKKLALLWSAMVSMFFLCK